MQKLSRLQETVTQWTSIEQRSQDFLGLVELAIAESDPSLEETLTDCLLYTSDAADDTPCVDLGGRRII